MASHSLQLITSCNSYHRDARNHPCQGADTHKIQITVIKRQIFLLSTSGGHTKTVLPPKKQFWHLRIEEEFPLENKNQNI